MINVGDLLTQRARLNPSADAFVDGETRDRLSFQDLNRRANRAANLLLSQGFCAGERVALMSRNSAEFVELYFALAKIGVICVPLSWRLAEEELHFIIRDCAAVGLIYTTEFKEMVNGLKNREGAGDLRAWIEIGPDTTASGEDLDYV